MSTNKVKLIVCCRRKIEGPVARLLFSKVDICPKVSRIDVEKSDLQAVAKSEQDE